ncbi:MFS transporter [Streptomyces tailanensis]|uniref:MFS transporter n=1 Tax=Streptomyces tailanensis TaxID=2569858 RepID=UPI00122E692F|nr:MFS transporter [Streptomyces tailanensis]
MTAEALPMSRPAFGQRQVHAVAACYFVASFAALGLPPFFTEILPELDDRTARWAGVLYVVPTVFSAIAAPLWGRLADRFGRKRLLLRAQLGLAVSFLLAGWADSLTMFTVALVLQGILGGTFAASNGYLGAALEGAHLSKALTLMQGSARAALVFAPIVVGALSPWMSPHRQYALLALLPLAAALLLAALPEPGETAMAEREQEAETTDIAPATALHRLYALEFAFVFSTVISFPYLISLVEERLPNASAALSGLLFALPHLCYLVSAMAVHRVIRTRPRQGMALGFALIALGLAGHGVAGTLPALIAVRLLLGAGLTLGMVGLSVMAAECARGRAPGGMFGSLEFFSKAGAVAAGVTAAVGSARFGSTAPVLIGGGIAALTTFATLLPPQPRTRWSH